MLSFENVWFDFLGIWYTLFESYVWQLPGSVDKMNLFDMELNASSNGKFGKFANKIVFAGNITFPVSMAKNPMSKIAKFLRKLKGDILSRFTHERTNLCGFKVNI